MKLTKEVTVQKIKILGKYQKKDPNPIVIAILNLALEYDNKIWPTLIMDELTGVALNEKMCTNILQRFIQNEWMESPGHSDSYRLTELGREMAIARTSFKPMKGELEITLLKEPISWFPHQILEIKVADKGRKDQPKGKQKTIQKEQFSLNKLLEFKSNSFILQEIEEKSVFIEESTAQLEVMINEEEMTVNLIDQEFTSQQTDLIRFKHTQLNQKYGDDFEDDTVFIPFDGDLSFKRSVQIASPTIKEVKFNPIKLPDIPFMAQTIEDARQWRLEWIKCHLKFYIHDKGQFAELEHKTQVLFNEFYSLSLLRMDDFENYLEQQPQENFYHLAKIRTPQLLTY